jgi:hypothetical protein
MKLKLCPFCGSTVRFLRKTKTSSKGIYCNKCTMIFRIALECEGNVLIHIWNKRI